MMFGNKDRQLLQEVKSLLLQPVAVKFIETEEWKKAREAAKQAQEYNNNVLYPANVRIFEVNKHLEALLPRLEAVIGGLEAFLVRQKKPRKARA